MCLSLVMAAMELLDQARSRTLVEYATVMVRVAEAVMVFWDQTLYGMSVEIVGGPVSGVWRATFLIAGQNPMIAAFVAGATRAKTAMVIVMELHNWMTAKFAMVARPAYQLRIATKLKIVLAFVTAARF